MLGKDAGKVQDVTAKANPKGLNRRSEHAANAKASKYTKQEQDQPPEQQL